MPKLLKVPSLRLLGSRPPDTPDLLLIVQVRLLALCCQLSVLLCRCAEALDGDQIL